MQHPAANQTDENLLVATVFRLLAMLVSFGYYDEPSHVTPLLSKIISYLDGKKDFLIVTEEPKQKKRMS